jgi:crotonobetainyl-CoA:carnitine CoA-transferase CaiB-like acyl-CoA transferase
MKPLTDLRILELTHMVSGPYAGALLADLGAETIKIEPPGKGEATRGLMAEDPRFNVNGMGPYFLSLNRNKKSVTLNLKSPEGLAIFYDLVRVSDVVLNNYRVGVVERLKIDYAHLSAVNPRIVTCSITGFGETGPDRELPAYDMVVQAMSGVMSVTGDPAGPPARAGIPISDVSSSMLAAFGIMAALHERSRTGLGRHVDISMLDAQLSAMNYSAAIALMAGEAPVRLGSAHRNHVPYNVYHCRDGHLIVGVVTDEFWASLVRILGLDELDTEENRGRAGRLENRAAIDRILAEKFASHDRAHWLEILRAGRIPAAPVNNYLEAFAEAQVQSRGMVADVVFPDGTSVRMPGNPVKLSSAAAEYYAPPPALGEHNREVLGEVLGLPDSRISELAQHGII